MSSTSGFGPHVQHSIALVKTMVDEFRFAEAAVFMFHLNKWHSAEWAYVKDELLKMTDPSKMSMLTTVIQCSEKSDLSSCNALIPGLYQYTQFGSNPELLD